MYLYRIKKVKILFRIILIIIVLFFIIEFIAWQLYLSSFPKKVDWYSEDFTNGIDQWRCLDATYLLENHDERGVLKLSKNSYFAPSAMKSIDITHMGQESFVFYFRVYSASFLGDVVNLGSLSYATGELSIVEKNNGYLGLATNMMEKATFSTNKKAKLHDNQWNDIYLYYDNSRKLIRLYNDKNLVLTIKDFTISMPLNEIWLGSIWIVGEENYGAPTDIEYSFVNISNKGRLPKLNFWEFIATKFS